MDQFTVRQFLESEWKNYRSIRLEALAAHPQFFSPSQDETKLVDEDWRKRLLNKNAAIFGLYNGDTLIGLTGILRDKSTHEKAHLVMSYIRTNYRQRGLSRLLYNARISWAPPRYTKDAVKLL